MTAPLLEIRGLSKSYGETRVLQNIDLDVASGEVVTLIGASGSGKSTLLRCVNGLEEIQAGTISIDGDVVSGRGVDLVRLRRKVGIIFQSFNLFPHMTALTNCTVAPITTGLYDRATAKERALEMLTRVGLEDRAMAYPDQLSGGQQQRVAIARAMVMRPEILLLDEITSALDPELKGEVLDLVRELAHTGMTMLLTTHELFFAREISDQICFLCQGTILERGRPEELLKAPKTAQAEAFLRRVAKTGLI